MSSSVIDFKVIVDELAARIRTLAPELLPNGARAGQEWRVGSLAGEKGQSLAVHIGRERPGVWCDFATGEAGDAFDLVAEVLYGGDKKQAYRWARNWLGLDQGPIPQERRRKPPPPDAKGPPEESHLQKRAFSIWLGARPEIAGTPVEAYLKGRGLDVARLGRFPRALRFAPELYNVESDRRWPAMLAAIGGRSGKTVAIHRTWLSQDRQDGTVRKAPLADPKMTLGRYRGGAIRLWRGASGKPLAQAPADDTVALVEGIEDGFTVALARPELRVLVAVSLANLAEVALPPQLNKVLICADNDHDNLQAGRALERAIQNHARAGRHLWVARAPKGYKDLNEMINAETGEIDDVDAFYG